MKDQRPSRERDQRSCVPTVHRRRFIAVGGGVGAALLAGCTSDDGPADRDGGDDPDEEGANFRLLVSDAPADIDDFDRLDVTLDSARVFDGGEGDETDDEEEEAAEADENGTSAEDEQADDGPSEDYQQTENTTDDEATETATPTEDEADDEDDETDEEPEDGTGAEEDEGTETDGGDEEGADAEGEEDGDAEGREGYYVLDLEDATVDLTRVVGDRAVPVFDGELSAGSYQKLELHVADVEGVVDDEIAAVKVPSGKLQITKPFEVRTGEAVDFVFDINVVKRGQEESYNLQPVISESGVAGEDVEVEEVDESEARGGREDAGEGDERAGDDGDETGGETGGEDGRGAGDGDVAEAGDDGAGGSNGSADSTGETPDGGED